MRRVTTPAPANTTLPAGLEIFWAGRRTADDGTVWDITPQDVAEVASGYNPKLREAPILIGHEEKGRPAFGWVDSLATNAAGKLLMNSRDVHPAYADAYAKRRFPKFSAAFYPKTHPNNPTPGRWYLRHVAGLGAEQPAVAGLLDPTLQQLSFADGGEGLVCFSEPTEELEDVSKELEEAKAAEVAQKQRAEAAEAEAKTARERLAAFAEAATKERHDSHVAFADAAFKDGRLTKPQVPLAVAALDFIGGIEGGATVQFSEGTETRSGSVMAFFRDCISNRTRVANFSEVLPGSAGGGAGSGGGQREQLSDEEIDRRARALAADKGCSYSEALNKVVSFTG